MAAEPSPLKPEYYLEPARFERDRNEIFFRSWQCVCHVSEVANAGDYATHDILGERVFILRSEDDALHAFHNLCRHRGHPLVQGSGNTGKRMICPYHAWCYDLEGRVVNVPGASKEELALCREMSLTAVRCEILCGFVFVNLDPAAPPISETYGELEPVVRSFHPDPARLRFVCETSIEHQCNWKISIENYNECYHCPTVHGASLARGVLDMADYRVLPHGWMIWHEGKAQQRYDKQYDYDTEHGPRGGDYAAYWLWPNVALCCYPGGYFTIRQWLPQTPRKTIYRYRWFSDGNIADADVESLMHRHRETTGAEDEAVVGHLQQAVESRAYRAGPYILGDSNSSLSEIGVRHFHELYRKVIHGADPA